MGLDSTDSELSSGNGFEKLKSSNEETSGLNEGGMGVIKFVLSVV